MVLLRKELLGVNKGGFKETTIFLSGHEALNALSKKYKIEVGAVLTPTGTIEEMGTDFHHSKLRSFRPETGSGKHLWHTHPGPTHIRKFGIVDDVRGLSAGDSWRAHSAAGWIFATHKDGSLYGLDGTTGKRYLYSGEKWKYLNLRDKYQ